MSIFIYYILPNILLFGSIYFIAKYYEKVTWELIIDMCDEERKENFLRKAIYSII